MIIHIKGNIKKIFSSDLDGAEHLKFIVNDVQSMDGQKHNLKEVFCAVRFGDSFGILTPFQIEEGTEIELKGELVRDQEKKDEVLHYTHHPVGFVIYNGQEYK
jgi:hypothetical protein